MKHLRRDLDHLDYFKHNSQPYYIFSLPYQQNSAGLRAYHMLCHILNEMGYEAYMVSGEPVLNLRTPMLTYQVRQKHIAEGRRPIAVYGETTEGNPLLCDTVVRWINNKIGRVGESIAINKKDLVFCWIWDYVVNTDAPISHIKKEVKELKKNKIVREMLYLPIIDQSIFYTSSTKDINRSGFCYYAHKYLRFDGGKVSQRVTENGISLGQEIKRSPKEIADILRSTRVLFLYEESAMAVEAMLCGCVPVLVRNGECTASNPDIQTVDESEIDFNLPYKARKSFKSRCMETWNNIPIYINNFAQHTQKVANGVVAEPSADKFVDFLKSNTDIYVYGTAEIAKQCYQYLRVMLNKSPNAFVVSDEYFEANTFLFDIPVLKLSDVPMNTSIVLAMTSKHVGEVIASLERIGHSHYMRYPLLQK